MRTETTVLIDAMRILANDIHSEDGVANAAIAEAADRLDELQADVERLRARNDDLLFECNQAGDAIATLNEANMRERSNSAKLREKWLDAKDDIETTEQERDQLKVLNESLWETFFHVAEMLGIDYAEARKHPGKPSDVYREALAAHNTEVIERFVGGGIINCIKAISPEISQHKNTLCIRELKTFRDSAIEHGVDSIQRTANQLRQQAKEVQS